MGKSKKGKKITMDLGAFLQDDEFGSSGNTWATDNFNADDLDLNAGNSLELGGTTSFAGAKSGPVDAGTMARQNMRQEYPVPDEPPFTARVNNIAHESTEGSVYEFFTKGLNLENPREEITDFYAPVDSFTRKLRGFAFITFATRELLEEALKLNSSELDGRTIYVSVAAPDKHSHAGGPPRGGRMPREPEPVLDWGAARNSREEAPTRPTGAASTGDHHASPGSLGSPSPFWTGAPPETPGRRPHGPRSSSAGAQATGSAARTKRRASPVSRRPHWTGPAPGIPRRPCHIASTRGSKARAVSAPHGSLAHQSLSSTGAQPETRRRMHHARRSRAHTAHHIARSSTPVTARASHLIGAA